MNDQTRALLHAYHDGELDPGQRTDVERRLENDPELARHLDELRAVDAALGLLPVAAPATDFTQSVRTDAALELLPGTSPSVRFTQEAVSQAQVDGALELLSAADVSSGFVAGVVERAESEKQKTGAGAGEEKTGAGAGEENRGAGAARGRVLRIAGAVAAVAAAVVAGVLFLRAEPAQSRPDTAAYVPYEWETDGETYPSMALDDLEDEILKELGAT